MSFTREELKRLQIADQVEDLPARRPGRPCIGLEPLRYVRRRSRWGGRPRKPYEGPAIAKRRKQHRESKARAKIKKLTTNEGTR